MAVLSSEPHSVLKDLLENNAASPDGSWVVSVNDGWLEHKKMKNFQIALQQLLHLDDAAKLESSARTSRAYFDIVLYAPTRAKRWQLYQSVKAVLNNTTLTTPTNAGGYAGVESSGVQQIIIAGFGGVDIRWFDEECGPYSDESDCKGYRVHISVIMRWQE